MTDKIQERNPFVLVLVDGDGYLVRENYRSILEHRLTLSSSKNTLSRLAAKAESMRPKR